MIEKHFRVYNDLVSKIRIKNMELVKLREDYYTITGTNYEKEKIKGVKPMDMADQLHRIIELEKDIEAITNYKDEVKRMHEKEIDNISDNKKRIVLKLFYLSSCSIKEIANFLKVSDGHVKKLKRGAIEEFKEKVIKV